MEVGFLIGVHGSKGAPATLGGPKRALPKDEAVRDDVVKRANKVI